MLPHLVNFLRLCVHVFASTIGTNPLGFTLMLLDSLASIGVSLFRILRQEGIAAMREHWKRTAWVTVQTVFWVTLVLYGPVAIYSIVKAIYDDHQSLSHQLSELSEFAKQKEAIEARSRAASQEAERWRTAYFELSHGDIHPDRVMTTPQIAKLFDSLQRIAKDGKNKDYVKDVEIGSVCDGGEPYALAGQLLSTFHESHWPVMWRSKLGSAFGDLGSRYAFQQIRVTVLSDDKNKAQFIGIMLSSAGIEVNDLTWVRELPPKFKGTLIWVGYKP